MEWLTNYSGSFGKHNVKAMAGYSYQYSQYSGLNASNKDFPNDALGPTTWVLVSLIRKKVR